MRAAAISFHCALALAVLCIAPANAEPPKPLDNNSTPGDIEAALQGVGPNGIIMRGMRRPDQSTVSSAAFQINFAFASAELLGDAPDFLGKIGAAMKTDDLARARFLLIGHTDGVGEPDRNMKLSLARARSAWAFLTATQGIMSDRLLVAGCGETRLLTPQDERAGENRRVEIVNLQIDPNPNLSGCTRQ